MSAFQNTDPAGAKELLDGDEGTVFVDVRTVEEFDAGHVPGAHNIPFGFATPLGLEPNPDFVSAIKRLYPLDSRLVFG